MKIGIKDISNSILVKSFLLRFTFFTIAWIILLEGHLPGDIWLVILFITVSSTISIFSFPPGQWALRPWGLMKFFFYFMLTAVRGGLDTARRVFVHQLSIEPIFVTIENKQDSIKTLILAWVISLLPGTASCEIKESTLVIHVLDKSLPFEKEIEELQRRIDEMFVSDK